MTAGNKRRSLAIAHSEVGIEIAPPALEVPSTCRRRPGATPTASAQVTGEILE